MLVYICSEVTLPILPLTYITMRHLVRLMLIAITAFSIFSATVHAANTLADQYIVDHTATIAELAQR